jgi:hypothetical protein
MPEFFSIREFALMMKVSEITIRRAIKTGRIHAFRISSQKNAALRIHEGQIARIMMLDLSIEYDQEEE